MATAGYLGPDLRLEGTDHVYFGLLCLDSNHVDVRCFREVLDFFVPVLSQEHVRGSMIQIISLPMKKKVMVIIYLLCIVFFCSIQIRLS